MIALGKRITGAACRFSSKKNKRGVRLWGIGLGWVFFGLVTFPKDDAIRASKDFLDARAPYAPDDDDVA